jgi:hypothetical protein
MEPHFPIVEWDLHFVSQTKKYRTRVAKKKKKTRYLTQEEGARRAGPGKQEAGDRPGDH